MPLLPIDRSGHRHRAGNALSEVRQGKNTRHLLTGLQAVINSRNRLPPARQRAILRPRCQRSDVRNRKFIFENLRAGFVSLLILYMLTSQFAEGRQHAPCTKCCPRGRNRRSDQRVKLKKIQLSRLRPITSLFFEINSLFGQTNSLLWILGNFSLRHCNCA